ncbi:MAG: 1-acyl-sn-glycerol-3-phosphate acyltransferase [Acidimicrobiia bacterium]
MAGEPTPRPPRSGPALVSVPSAAHSPPGPGRPDGGPSGTDADSSDPAERSPAAGNAAGSGSPSGSNAPGADPRRSGSGSPSGSSAPGAERRPSGPASANAGDRDPATSEPGDTGRRRDAPADTDRPGTTPADTDRRGNEPGSSTRSRTGAAGRGSTGTRAAATRSTRTRSTGRRSTTTRSTATRSTTRSTTTTSGRRSGGTRASGGRAANAQSPPGRPGRLDTSPTTGERTAGVRDLRAAPGPPTAGVSPTGPGPAGAEPTGPAPSGPHPTDPDRLTDVDEWGRSEHLRALVRQLTDPVYERWFRVEWQGFETIPSEGGAMLVANHAGAIPFDAPVIMHGIERELGRPVYGLADDVFRRVPVVNLAWSRLGGVQAHPENAYRLLREQQQLVTVFPEGADGPGKTFDERYRLRRFGRGGFVQLAMRAGVPIIPLAVIGSEETMPILFKVPALSRLLGLPYVPVTANMVALGPLGLVPFPAKIVIRVLDPVHFDEPPDQPRYSRSRIMDAAEDIRHTIQSALYDMLRQRRSVWTG